MKSFNFLLNERKAKPREAGVTMVLDKGLGYETADSLMNISGKYVDYLKFGWGTIVVHEQDLIEDKVDMYKSYDVTPYTGGTLFELAYYKNKLDEFYREADKLGFNTIEISDGSTLIKLEDKLKLIEESISRGFNVLSEVGKKDPNKDKQLTIDERITYMVEELKSGAKKVIVESREGGKNIGVFDEKGNVKESEVDAIIDKINPKDIIWEAPQKDQQVFFIKKLGRDVNLGNISCDEITALETLRCGLRGDTFGMF